jgi:ribosomal protein S18 acetylase RimI-like enzyme
MQQRDIKVTKLTNTQAEAAAELLARAFHDQPYNVFIEPDVERRRRLLVNVFRWRVRHSLMYGEPYAAGDPIAGVALVIPPGATHATAEQERASGLDRMEEVFGQAAFERAAPLGDLLRERHDRDMQEPHWYLPILGVDPSHQGTGVGGALLRAVIARAAEDLLPCYLDTAQPKNVAFYRRHGFEVLTHGVEPISGLPYWTFRRD